MGSLHSYCEDNASLAKHWNQLYPEAKEEMKTIINDIKLRNEQHRKSK
jgi:hypothetical protein